MPPPAPKMSTSWSPEPVNMFPAWQRLHKCDWIVDLVMWDLFGFPSEPVSSQGPFKIKWEAVKPESSMVWWQKQVWEWHSYWLWRCKKVWTKECGQPLGVGKGKRTVSPVRVSGRIAALPTDPRQPNKTHPGLLASSTVRW